MTKPKVMIVGLGSLGSVVLELLAREAGVGDIVVASRSEARGELRCNLARVGALAQGANPHIQFVTLDLDDTSGAADIITRHSPDIILCTASLQTWWLAELLPAEPRARLARAPFGAWLPVHLTLALEFMQAIRQAGYRGHAIVASFPDVVNVVLGRLGLAPTCGVGNLDEIVPKLRDLAALRLHASADTVRVLLVAHHALEPLVFAHRPAAREVPPAPPHWVRVEHDGKDVTRQVDADRLLFEPYPLPAGPAWHFLTAASAVHLVRALAGDAEDLVHVPSPAGLPGGYPAMVSRNGVRLLDIPSLPRAGAIAINEQSQPYDGIERIDDDGTVHFTAEARQVLGQTLGYNCARLRPEDSRARATELMTRFREYASRHGVDLAAAEAVSRAMM